MKIKNIWWIGFLSVSLFACGTYSNNAVETPALTLTPLAGAESAVPTFTPWAGGTETALANPTSFNVDETSLTLLPTFPPSEATQEVMEKPTDFTPVLFGGKLYDSTFFLLLGGVSRDAWLTPDESVTRFSGEATYRLYSVSIREPKYFLWGEVPEYSPTCRQYTVGTDADLDEFGFVAVIDGWNVTKRDVIELSEDEQFYQQAVTDWLAGEGVASPQLGTLHIFRVDIEVDGTDEIFLAATHLDGSQHTTKAGDYSIILMRKVVGNIVLTIPIVSDIYSSQEEEITFPRTYSISNFIDLNQDGVLEVVVGVQKWEGFGAIVYQLDGQNVTRVLEVVC